MFEEFNEALAGQSTSTGDFKEGDKIFFNVGSEIDKYPSQLVVKTDMGPCLIGTIVSTSKDAVVFKDEEGNEHKVTDFFDLQGMVHYKENAIKK